MPTYPVMLSKTIRLVLVLFSATLCVSCSTPQRSSTSVSRTEIELLITDPDTAPEEIVQLIDFVSYRITCLESGLVPYDDSIDLYGNFGVDPTAEVPVWELVMSLPLSDCVIAMWVFYEGTVVCEGSEVVSIVDDSSPLAPNKVDVELTCSLSVDPPSGDVDIDADFDFIDGNFCPKLNWVGALPIDVPPGNPVTTIEVRAFDPDETCGLNCDPRTCDFTVNPPECTSGVDPGFSAQFFAPSGLGSFSLTSAAGTPLEAESVYTCDLDAPGLTEICVTVTDGTGTATRPAA